LILCFLASLFFLRPDFIETAQRKKKYETVIHVNISSLSIQVNHLSFTRRDIDFPHDKFTAKNCNVVSAEGILELVDHQFRRQKPIVVTFLRHPLLRTVSQWNHDLIMEVKYRSDHPSSSLSPTATITSSDPSSSLLQSIELDAKDGFRFHKYTQFGTLEHLFQSLPRDQIHPRYRNWMTSRLKDKHRSSFVSNTTLLHRIAFFGITEYYTTSICLFYFTFQVPHRSNHSLDS
jgi:hypothetical protein